MPTTPVAVVVPVKSAWKSKINWGVAISLVAAFGTFFGFDLDPETQVQAQLAITSVTAVYVWVMKTFFTNTVTPSAIPATTTLRE